MFQFSNSSLQNCSFCLCCVYMLHARGAATLTDAISVFQNFFMQRRRQSLYLMTEGTFLFLTHMPKQLRKKCNGQKVKMIHLKSETDETVSTSIGHHTSFWDSVQQSYLKCFDCMDIRYTIQSAQIVKYIRPMTQFHGITISLQSHLKLLDNPIESQCKSITFT